jgi:hypothetical protein
MCWTPAATAASMTFGASRAEDLSMLQARITDEIFGALAPDQRREMERLLRTFVEAAGDETADEC